MSSYSLSRSAVASSSEDNVEPIAGMSSMESAVMKMERFSASANNHCQKLFTQSSSLFEKYLKSSGRKLRLESSKLKKKTSSYFHSRDALKSESGSRLYSKFYHTRSSQSSSKSASNWPLRLNYHRLNHVSPSFSTILVQLCLLFRVMDDTEVRGFHRDDKNVLVGSLSIIATSLTQIKTESKECLGLKNLGIAHLIYYILLKCESISVLIASFSVVYHLVRLGGTTFINATANENFWHRKGGDTLDITSGTIVNIIFESYTRVLSKKGWNYNKKSKNNFFVHPPSMVVAEILLARIVYRLFNHGKANFETGIEMKHASILIAMGERHLLAARNDPYFEDDELQGFYSHVARLLLVSSKISFHSPYGIKQYVANHCFRILSACNDITNTENNRTGVFLSREESKDWMLFSGSESPRKTDCLDFDDVDDDIIDGESMEEGRYSESFDILLGANDRRHEDVLDDDGIFLKGKTKGDAMVKSSELSSKEEKTMTQYYYHHSVYARPPTEMIKKLFTSVEYERAALQGLALTVLSHLLNFEETRQLVTNRAFFTMDDTTIRSLCSWAFRPKFNISNVSEAVVVGNICHFLREILLIATKEEEATLFELAHDLDLNSWITDVVQDYAAKKADQNFLTRLRTSREDVTRTREHCFRKIILLADSLRLLRTIEFNLNPENRWQDKIMAYVF